MANNYLKLSFTISPTQQEAELLDECYDLSADLDDADEEERTRLWAERSDAFKAAFPPAEGDDDPFASFRNLFNDAAFPTFDVESFGPLDEDGAYLIAGSQADPDAIARVIQKCAPSVLPFGFEWASTCDRLRPGEFGGGYYVVTVDDIIGGSTSWLMRADLVKLKETG